MVQSMTAFATDKIEADFGTGIWELRSVNHRYLELHIRLPEMLSLLETKVRELVRHHLQRGKVDCILRFHANANTAQITLNQELLTSLKNSFQAVQTIMPNAAAPGLTDLLRWPGVLQNSDLDIHQLEQPLLALLEKTLQDLKNARSREGEKLANIILPRLTALSAEVDKVESMIKELLPKFRARLDKKLVDVKTSMDPNRLEQEIVLYAHKIDVTEEIDRLRVHIKEVARLLTSTGTHGRRLDFLMQELTREANTLGSKTNDAAIIHAGVEMKVIIEQIREQIQNIE